MTFILNDDMVFDLTKMLYNEFKDEEEERKLDQDNLQQFKKNFIRPLYPHEQYYEDNEKKTRKYQCSKFCCQLTPGSFFCCDSNPPDDVYKKFGLGACLYFKFLRHLMCFFIFISILSVFSVLLYYMISINNGFDLTGNYANFVFAGTAGSLSAERFKCQYGLVQSNSSQFTLECKVGQVLKKSVVSSVQTLNSLPNCRAQRDKINNNNSSYIFSYNEVEDCESDNSKCTISISNITGLNSSHQYASYVYQCQNSAYPLGSIQFTPQIVMYVTVSIDLAIIFFFLLFLCSQNQAQITEQNYFKGQELALNDFSLKVDGFNSITFDNEFDFFVKGMDKKLEIVDGFAENIVQVKIPDTEQMRTAIQKRRQCYQKLFDLIEYCFFDELIDVNNYQNTQDFIKRCYGHAQDESYIQYKLQLTENINHYMDSKELKIQENEGKQASCYLVMSNPKYKRLIFQSAQQKCFKKFLSVQQRQYPISQPPVADMILWENKYKWTWLRVIIVWIITLAICFGSYILVGLANFQKQQLQKNNDFTVDCGVLFTNNQLSTWDPSLDGEKGYIHCYCFKQYFEDNNFSGAVFTTCEVWHTEYLLYIGIPVLISLGIVLYNVIISRFFKIMTKCEGHDELTTQLYSYIMKRTFVLVMNMGLIMILLQLEYPGEIKDLSFLFQGTYNDVTSDWYLEIGVIITLTLAINIFLPIIEMLLVGFLRWLRRLWDRRCCCRKTSQKTKKGYLELYSGDVYPIEERYADLLSVVIITLAFSAVMPGLYIIACFSLIFMNACDKCLLFRVYQHPVNYTAKLQKKIFKTVYLALVIHCLASALLLSEPNLVVGDTNLDVIINTGESRIDDIFLIGYLVPFVIFFILLVVWGFFNATLISLIQCCYRRCKQHEMSMVRKDKLNTNFYHSLDEYQTNRLKLSLEREVNKKFHRRIQKRDNVKSITNANQTQSYFATGTQVVHQRQIICRMTLKRLKEREKQGKNASKSRTKLIGKAGYEQIFSDQIFQRERKIRILDNNLKEAVQRQIQERTISQVQLSDITLQV